jgi:hypothetical protein
MRRSSRRVAVRAASSAIDHAWSVLAMPTVGHCHPKISECRPERLTCVDRIQELLA